MVSELIANLSRMASSSGVNVYVRMMVCGGGKSSILAASGAPAGVGDLNQMNAQMAYQEAISRGVPEHIAQRIRYAIGQGMSPQQAYPYAFSGSSRRRRRKGTKRISRRRRKTVRSR
jgi:hypothetical protein